MPDRSIFCSAPWYELQIYWDGSLGFCCQESHKLYSDSLSEIYNVKNISIKEWYNSEPMKQARSSLLGDSKVSFCQRCYNEESASGTSRRYRTNVKNVIFVKNNFEESYQQSPAFSKFNHSFLNAGDYNQMPVDIHIDLGNYCNLACKMCWAGASSKIAAQEVKWGNLEFSKYVGSDWTRDNETWNRVLYEIASIEKLKNVHFMGGETLITKRFEDFVDFMIDQNKTNIGISFVTNGTTFNQSLLEKLLKFKRVGIEVSIETTTLHNTYQRQGTDTESVLKHIQRYRAYDNNDNITVTVRPAISLLTIGNYDTLLEYCLEHKLLVKSLLVTKPRYFDIVVLPESVKLQYQTKYLNLQQKYNFDSPYSSNNDINRSDPNRYKQVIRDQIDMCLNLLKTETPPDSEQQLKLMVQTCRKWDQVYGYDARNLYPELIEIFDKYGY